MDCSVGRRATTSSRLRRSGARAPVTRTPASTRRRVQGRRVVGTDHDLVRPSYARPGRRAARRLAPTSGVRTRTSPVRRGMAAMSSCSTSRPRSRTPTRVHICSISASRWLDRKTVVPGAVQRRAAARGCRGCPAGRGRWSARRARAAAAVASGRRRARAAAACRGSRPWSGACVGTGRARPARAPRRCGAVDRRGAAARPAASKSARLARPERCG